MKQTVAKKGPKKKPRKLMATEAAMIFGTLSANMLTTKRALSKKNTHNQNTSIANFNEVTVFINIILPNNSKNPSDAEP